MRLRVRNRLTQRSLGCRLDAVIDRQTNVVAWLGSLRTHDRTDGVAEGIDASLERAIRSAQIAIEIALNTTLADEVARLGIAVRNLIFDLVGRDLSKLAPEVRCQWIGRTVRTVRCAIGTSRTLDNSDTRILCRPLLEIKQHIAIDVAGEHNRVEWCTN